MVEVTPKYVYDSTFLHHFPAAHIKDEISTLFVVGFPENIQQREFQNMFLFSPGFEAATLKISSKAIDADLLSDNRKQIVSLPEKENKERVAVTYVIASRLAL